MRTNVLLAFVFLFSVSFVVSCTARQPNPSDKGHSTVDGSSAPETGAEGGGGVVKGDPPEALVAELYKQHDAKKGPFFQKDRSRIDKYFTKSLGDLILRDATEPLDGTGAFGADPLYDAQDIDLKNFQVGKGVVDGKKATVPVTFTNFGEKKTVTFYLSDVAGTWRIADLKYQSGDMLLKALLEAYGTAKTNAPPVENNADNFEGRYSVGETTCTVRAVKMAFEVRWAKGDGVEMYFSQPGNIFESEEDKTRRRNQFIFENDTYDAGTFVRPDGKVFTVRRKD